MALTLKDMVDRLDIYANQLNQAKQGPNVFTPTYYVAILNESQTEIVKRLSRNLLPELDTSSLANALDSNGDLDLTGLSTTIGDNGQAIDMVKVTDDSASATGYPAIRISFKQWQNAKELNTIFSLWRPIYYIRGDTLHFEPYDESPTLDIYYMADPVAMALATLQASWVTSELGEDVKHIIMEWATGILFRTGNDYVRARGSEVRALDMIEDLNARYPESDTTKDGKFVDGEAGFRMWPHGGYNHNRTIYTG